MVADRTERIELLRKRSSIRTYSSEPLAEEIINKLKAEATFINTHEFGLKFQLFFNDDSPFNSFFKSYGTFVNPRNYLAAVVDEGVADIWEKAGYFAEQFVIKAVSLGLGTCFVGGTYDAQSVNAQLRAGEKILFLVLFGQPIKINRLKERLLVNFVHRKKMNPSDFFTPKEEFKQALEEFQELGTGMEGIACAPSALNKRPVRVFIKCIEGRNMICAKVDEGNKKNLIDLGIAKFNFNYATYTECEWGNCSPLMSDSIND